MTERVPFTITKFERHPAGYYTARVTSTGGATITVDNRWGSWIGERRIRPYSRDTVRFDLPRDVCAALAAKRKAADRREVAA